MRELDLLAHVYRHNAALPAAVAVPPGDDMAVLRIGGQRVLAAVDQVAEGVHVTMPPASPAQAGRKAVTRNLSDVAAMAAMPVAALAAASLPRDFGEARATALFDAMRETAEAFDCPLVGGDIAMWDQPLLLTVTVLAEPAGIEPVLRRGAQPGDGIHVTGALGGSLEAFPDGYTHHLAFTPRLAAARALAGHAPTRPHAMIDVSDGLARDLSHLCRASGVDAVIRVADLPLSRGAHQAAARTGWPAWRHALSDGEDYELLFAAPSDAVVEQVADVTVTRIGTIMPRRAEASRDEPTIVLEMPEGGRRMLSEFDAAGWEHGA